MSYYYFQYSDISSTSISEAAGGVIYQTDPSLAGFTVAQCANFGISLLGTDMGGATANFMVLTTEPAPPGSALLPRLEFYEEFFNYFIYDPSLTGVNSTKQLFCSSNNTFNIKYEHIGGQFLPEKAIDNTFNNLPVNSGYGGWSVSTPYWQTPTETEKFVVTCPKTSTDASGSAIIYNFSPTSLTTTQDSVITPTRCFDGINGVKVQSSCIWRLKASNEYYLALGAPTDISNGIALGAVYIYHYTALGVWESRQCLYSKDPQENEYFGWSISLGDLNLVVGAPRNNSCDGQCYTFLGNSNWTGITSSFTLNGATPFSSEQFGFSVSIHTNSGTLGGAALNTKALVVGSGEVSSGGTSSGGGKIKPYYSSDSGSSWAISTTTFTYKTYPGYGQNVSIGGNDINTSRGIIVAGCAGHEAQDLQPAGRSVAPSYAKVFVYLSNDPASDGFAWTTWTEIHRINDPSPTAVGSTGTTGNWGYFGQSVSYKSPYILIGQPGDVYGGAAGAGVSDVSAGYVYKYFNDGQDVSATLVSINNIVNSGMGMTIDGICDNIVAGQLENGGISSLTSSRDTSNVYIVDMSVNYYQDINFANPILFNTLTWQDNGDLPDVSSTYFQYSNKAGDTVDDITFSAPQIADFSNNYSLCAQYASSFLGTGGITANGEEKERKYFVLYADDTNTASRRIAFLSDISGAYFNTSDLSGRQIFCQLGDTSGVNSAYWSGTDNSMSYSTPLYFTEEGWLKTTPTPPDSNFYFQWSDISGYNIFDLPIAELTGQAFDGSSIAQMANYGTSFLNKMLVDTEGVPRECKYFVLYTNDLSENRIQFKYDASGNDAGIFYSPKTQYYNGLNYNKQVFCSSANAIEIKQVSSDITGGFDCSFANEIKFFEDKWVDNNQLVTPPTSYFRTSNIVAEYDGSANPQVDIISYNAPQLTGIADNYAECAAYASKFFGTIGLTDPSGTGNWEEEERKYFVLITDDTDPSAARIQFKYDGSGAYHDLNCGAGGLAINTQIFCPSIDVVPLQEAPGPNYDPYLTTIGTNTMASSHPRHFLD